MTPKERAAMQQALEALVKSTGELHRFLTSPTDMQLITNHNAITALREALAEPHKQNCACEVCRGCDNVDIKAEQAEQEPVAWMNTNGAVNKLREAGWAMNAAPVRTKDLTDDEIESVVANLGFAQLSPIEVARAVIAKDREKNNVK